MKLIKATLGVGLAGCRRTEEFEFDDEATEEEIEEVVTEWAFQIFDYGWQEV